MPCRHLVMPVRRDDGGRHPVETPPEEPQRVEGRLVRPVDVIRSALPPERSLRADVAALLTEVGRRFGVEDWTFVGTSEGSVSAFHGFVGVEVPTINAMRSWVKTGVLGEDVSVHL